MLRVSVSNCNVHIHNSRFSPALPQAGAQLVVRAKRKENTIPAMKESLADRRKRARERVASDIEEYGWHVLNVAPLEGDERQEWWSYTIGLIKTYDHPEICMFGFDFEDAMDIINWAGELVKKGRKFRDREETDEILTDRKVTFRAVESRWMSDYFPAIAQYYEKRDCPALQLVWPDLEGKYPW